MSVPRANATRGALVVVALIGAACDPPPDARNRESAGTDETLIEAEALSVKVQGGAIVSVTGRSSELPRVRVRAQSFDVRIDVVAQGCEARRIRVEVTHLPKTGVTTLRRTFRGAQGLLTEVSRSVLGSSVAVDPDPFDPGWTPLEPETQFEPSISEAGVVSWQVEVDPGLNRVGTRKDAGPASDGSVASLSCGGPAGELGGPLGQAPLVVRHRLKVDEPGGPFCFAAWGNERGNRDVRRRIIAGVNARAQDTDCPVRLAVINGDLTAEGTRTELDDAVADYDTLEVPWFATIGERDLGGSAEDALVGTLGALSFALDAGPPKPPLARLLRIVAVDSADATLTDGLFDQLDDWLTDDAAPPVRVVVTHFPPFDPAGLRGGALKHRQEGARFLAALHRGGARVLLTSHHAAYAHEESAELDIVHSGGGGARKESRSEVPHHWVLFKVDVDEAQPVTWDRVDL